MLTELTIKDFISKVISNDPVPGGGSVSALNGALAAALSAMVANLTVGRKKYAESRTWTETQTLTTEYLQHSNFQKKRTKKNSSEVKLSNRKPSMLLKYRWK